MTVFRDTRNGFRVPLPLRRNRSRLFLTVGSVGAAPRTSSSSSDSTSGVPIPLALDCPSSGVTSSGILQYLPSAGLNVLFVIKTLGAGLEAAESQVLLDDLVGLTVLDGLALVEP